MSGFGLARVFVTASVIFAATAVGTLWFYRSGVTVAWGILALCAASLARAELKRVRRSRRMEHQARRILILSRSRNVNVRREA